MRADGLDGRTRPADRGQRRARRGDRAGARGARRAARAERPPRRGARGAGARARRDEAVPCDLADRAEVERLADAAGDVDVLVANAGLPGSGTLPKLDQDEIDRVLEVNLRAPIALARLLAPAMVERGRGQLVFVASFAGKVPSAGESSIYTATKFGLRGFAHVLRAQMKRKEVGVSLVTPGPDPRRRHVRARRREAAAADRHVIARGRRQGRREGDRAQRRRDRRRVLRAARDVEAAARSRPRRSPTAHAEAHRYRAQRGRVRARRRTRCCAVTASRATRSARSPRWSTPAPTAIPSRPRVR